MNMTRRNFLAFSAAATATMLTPAILRRSNRTWAAIDDSLVDLDAVAQAKLIKKGDATPLELLDAAIQRIDALNPTVNAVVTEAYDSARERADAAAFDGPFRGVPFLVKDLNDVAGVRTTSGSRALMDTIAERDHPYIKACIAAGLNVCGKSNTPEFGLQATTESLALGPCFNPWDVTRSSGGSSGGAGAAVATGMLPLAHGNDGGGSIRIPASCCGVFGLMASRGRMAGTTNGFSLAVQGGLSRSVRDSAQLLASTERAKPAPGLEPVGLIEKPSRKRLKIGMYLNGARGETPDSDVQTAIESTAALCEELGHTVTPMELKYDGDRMVDDFLTLWSSTAGEFADVFEKEAGRPANYQDLEPLTLAFSKSYHAGGKQKMGAALQFLVTLQAEIGSQMEPYDVLLCPVLRTAPPAIGEQGPTVPYETLIARMISYVAYTPLFNITGLPAMSVPLYWNDAGLPIGSQFAAKMGDEATLLRLAYELEEARPWAGKHAPASVWNHA